MNNEPVAIVELGGEVTWLTDVLPYKAKLYTHPVKELTDGEIWAIASEIEPVEIQHGVRLSNDLNVLDFARAILRKAQEK